MSLPEAMERLFLQEVYQYQEAKRMPFIDIAERVGIEKGLLEGIEVLLEFKFGDEGLKLMPELRELQDYEALRAVLRAIKKAAKPEDLRKVWTRSQRRKNGREA
jgi:hypothetical protein